VHDAPLDGLEAVLDGGYRAVADGVRSELQEVLVHEIAQGSRASVRAGGSLAFGRREGAASVHGRDSGRFSRLIRRGHGGDGVKERQVVEQARRFAGGVFRTPFLGVLLTIMLPR
jgi:hypothetical protein